MGVAGASILGFFALWDNDLSFGFAGVSCGLGGVSRDLRFDVVSRGLGVLARASGVASLVMMAATSRRTCERLGSGGGVAFTCDAQAAL